eukprot:COSAG04_NODE_4337_length_2150_cov_1.236958_1_plen_371_part_00
MGAACVPDRLEFQTASNFSSAHSSTHDETRESESPQPGRRREEERRQRQEEQRRAQERQERERQAEENARKRARQCAVCKIFIWRALLFVGAAVQQVGWWSLYSELGLWCGLLGGVAVLLGALGIDCTWKDGEGDPLGRTCFWFMLVLYALGGSAATWDSATECPTLSTDDSSDSSMADAEDDCGHTAIWAGLSLIPLLSILVAVRAGLETTRRVLCCPFEMFAEWWRTAGQLRKAKRWLAMMLIGAAVQQAGWWSLYSDLGLWCGLLGFDCGLAGHSMDWNWCCCREGGPWGRFWFLLFLYALFGAGATWVSAALCPALGTDEGWGQRFSHDGQGCGGTPFAAGVSLLFLLGLLWPVCKELVAMGRAAQ